MMHIKNKLNDIGLTPDKAVVIGSGILNALNLRESKDIDVIVTKDAYSKLERDARFTKKQSHGREMLIDGLFEIGTSWGVLRKSQTFDDLLKQSIVIENTRYITIEFLLAAKKSWLKDNDVRQKDFDDVELIEKYLRGQK